MNIENSIESRSISVPSFPTSLARVAAVTLVALIACTSCDAPSLRYDGLYQSELNDDYRYYFRFYPQGEVIAVSSSGDAEEIASWFTIEHSGVSVGAWETDGAVLKFEARSKTGVVEYAGAIGKDGELKLHSISRINGHEEDRMYTFVKLNFDAQPPEDTAQ